MKYLYRLPVLLVLLAFGPKGHSQQDSQFTQYMYNTQTVNPAYAGSRGLLSFTSLYRSQWVGLEGAPETLNFGVSSPLGERVGGGLTFFRDEIGIYVEKNITTNFSYTLPLNEREAYFSFGLGAGVNMLDVDYSKLNPNDVTDPSFSPSNNVENLTSPVIGLGLYFRSGDTWYVGLSAPNLLETDHYDTASVSKAKEKMNVYLIGGYVFDLSQDLKFKPALLAKAVEGAPVAVDASANFLLWDKLTAGAAYRWDSAVSGLIGFQFSRAIFVGYAYDHDLTDLSNYNSGSHEFFLRFELGGSDRGIISPRFF